MALFEQLRNLALASIGNKALELIWGFSLDSAFKDWKWFKRFLIEIENNFPFKKEESDLDWGLTDGCDDAAYLDALGQSLDQMDSRFKPDCLIFLAGADPHESDRLGRLNVSTAGMRLRDEAVFQYALDRQLPIAFSMAGGYGKEMTSTVDIHFQTIKTALQFQKQY